MTEAQAKKEHQRIHKLFVGTFETELGQRCIEHLKKTFIDRPIYKAGMSIEDVAYRQGQYDLVSQILKEIN